MIALYFISYISCLVPFAIGLWFIKKATFELKLLLLFFLVVIAVESAGLYLGSHEIPHKWLFHVYTLIEYSFLALVFSYWQRAPLFRRVLRLSIPAFALIWLLAKLSIEDLNYFDNYTSSLESVLLIIIAAFTMIHLFKEESVFLGKDPRFWASVAILFYFTGNLMTFALSNIINPWTENEFAKVWASFHWVTNTLSNLLYSGSFLCLRTRTRSGGHLSSAP